jgi:diaminopimelate decarboxylase
MKDELNSKIWSQTSQRNNGVLTIGGCSVLDLAEKFGTPAFILDESDFRHRAIQWRESLERHFKDRAGTAYYAAKAFISKEVTRWVEESGLGLDVCTGGELAVAIAAKFPPARIEDTEITSPKRRSQKQSTIDSELSCWIRYKKLTESLALLMLKA